MPNFAGYYPIVAGVPTTVEVGQGGLAGVIIGCESGLSVVVKMGGNYSRSLYPGTVDYFPIPGNQFNGTIQLVPSSQLNNVATWPGSYAQVDTVGIGESVGTSYPMTLTRNANIGNTVPVSGNTAIAVQQDNTAGSNTILEATPSGGLSSFINCDGSATMQNDWHFVKHLTCDLGINANQITGEALNDIGITAQTGQKIVNSIGSNHIWDVLSTGPILLSGSLSFLSGSISRLSIVPNLSITAVQQTLNHNLGDVPDFIMLQPNGGSSASHTANVDFLTLTSTQFKVIGNGSFAAWALCIKL